MINIYHGDCLEVLRGMAEASVDSVVTDPPYGLSFMGKKWDYDVPSVEVWQECLRVLKPGGHLLAFAGTRTQHRMAVRIEDAGFEIRDMIAWVYGSGFPKSHNLDGEHEGWGTALKPALEPITMARKPLVGTVAANVQQHGTGVLNVDGCRVGTESTRRTCNGVGVSSSFDLAASGQQRINGSDSGRWPANLIHDGSEEAVGLFPASKQDSAARFFYCAKASKQDRGENAHPTVKPTDLMRYLCRLVTPKGGIVLDPFMGSGSTGKAAVLEGFRFIGIEREAEYVAIAKARIAAESRPLLRAG
jgi:DNA modification methylase